MVVPTLFNLLGSDGDSGSGLWLYQEGEGAMKQTFILRSPDGTEREVTEQEWQAAIDKQLAQWNGGVVPTTDEERMLCYQRHQAFCRECK